MACSLKPKCDNSDKCDRCIHTERPWQGGLVLINQFAEKPVEIEVYNQAALREFADGLEG